MVAGATSVCRAGGSCVPVFVCLENSTDGSVGAGCRGSLWRTSGARGVPGFPDAGEGGGPRGIYGTRCVPTSLLMLHFQLAQKTNIFKQIIFH